jgi:activating signal cointegrator complex subunit 2
MLNDDDDDDVVWLAARDSDDAMTVLRDRSFMDQMKTDILRRVEASSDSEDEETNIFGVASDHRAKGKGRVREVAFDDDLEDVSNVRVAGDGEESSENEDEDEGDGDHEMNPQTIVELAYIADPKVFERDAATRRSKERAALRAQTGAFKWRFIHSLTWMCAMTNNTPLPPQGWVDEQIEGFRIMLDRDVRPKTSHSKFNNIQHSQILLLLLPLTAKNERKDACKARVFWQQTTSLGIVVVWSRPGPE